MKKLTIKKSFWHETWRHLKKDKTALICGGFILAVCVVSLFAEYIAPYPFDEQNMDKILSSPSFEHWMGTDDLGRDLFSRLIYGARVSMAVGILTSLISLFLGVFYGALSGWFGGKIDALMMRFIDVLYSFPILILIILVKLIFESVVDIENPELRSLVSIVGALSIAGWVTLGRVARGQVLQIKESLYVESARALGAKGSRIIFKQILPNLTGPVIVLLTFQIPMNILSESFLSFLGLGLQPPYSSWGTLSASGWSSFRLYPYLIIAPSSALFLTMLAFNFFGDSLRDAAEPQS